MSTYIYIYVCVCFMLLSVFLFKNTDKYISYVVFVILLFFIGFRYDSVDYFGYWDIYNSISYEGLSGFSKEPGFALLNIIEQRTTGHFFYFIFFFSLLSLWIKYSALKKITPNLTLVLFIYISTPLFWKDLGQIRNGFIAGLMLYAVFFAYKKQFISFLMVILVGCFVHLASVVGLLIYIIGRIDSRKLMYAILMIGFLLGLGSGVSHLIFGVIPADAFGSLSARVHSYVGSDYDTEKNILGLASIANMALMIFVVFFYHRLKEVLPINSYFIPLAVVSLSLENAFMDFGIIGSRISDILFLPSLIVILSSFYNIKGSGRFTFIAAFLVYCFVFFAYSVANADTYQSILQFL